MLGIFWLHTPRRTWIVIKLPLQRNHVILLWESESIVINNVIVHVKQSLIAIGKHVLTFQQA